MSFCDRCGATLGSTSGTCAACGAAAAIPTAGPTPGTAAEPVIDVAMTHPSAPAGNPHQMKAIGVIAGAGITWIALELVSRRYAAAPIWLALCWVGFLLTLVPLASGAALVLACGSHTPGWMESFARWMDRRAAKAKASNGRFNDYVVSPAMWSYETLDGYANSIRDGILRNGAKAATYVFALMLFAVLLYVLTAIVLLVLVIMVAAFFINVFSPDKTASNFRSSPEPRSREATLHSGTSVFNEQVTGRVDADGNVFEGSSVFNERKVGRVDAEGHRYEGTSVFNERLTGRTDQDGNVLEGTSAFNERKTGRVDESGNVMEGSSVFNERKSGRIEKKDS